MNNKLSECKRVAGSGTLVEYRNQRCDFWGKCGKTGRQQGPQIKRFNARRKFDYQANRNVSAGLLKRFLIKFFLSARESFKEHYANYCNQILQSLEPLRPGKNKERRRRRMRGTERHVHEKTYRRAL